MRLLYSIFNSTVGFLRLSRQVSNRVRMILYKPRLPFKTKTYWDAPHLILVAVFLCVFIIAVLRALWAYNGNGYEVRAETVVPYTPETVWAWVTSEKQRSLWQAGVRDVAKMTGDMNVIDSTRRVFMVDGELRWVAIETTMEVEPLQRIKFMQVDTYGNRYFEVTLRPQSVCKTGVALREVGVVHDFWSRYFLFMKKSDHQERLTTSLKDMQKWMQSKGEVCKV